MTFADSTARDNALKLLEAKYQKSESYGVAVNITGTALVAARAKTKVQKSRTWALRKAFELLKHRAATASSRSKVEFDWEMPTRQVLVDGEPAFVQEKYTLRGIFVGKHFDCLQLPV